MTTTIGDIIKQALVNACLNATRPLRDANAKKKKSKYSAAKISEVRALFKSLGWDESNVDRLMMAFSILNDDEGLKPKPMLKATPFVVMKFGASASGQNYGINTPRIVTDINGEVNVGCLNADGKCTPSWAGVTDQPEYCTDEEIRQCIKNLTEAQWKTIRTDAHFKPIMDSAYATSVQVDGNDEEKTKNAESDNKVSITPPAPFEE